MKFLLTILLLFSLQVSAQINYLGFSPGAAGTYNGNAAVSLEFGSTTLTNLKFSGTLKLVNCNNITIEECYFEKATNPNIELEDCSNINIEKNVIANGATGVYAVDCIDIRVINNEFINMHGPFPRGQHVQFNRGTGSNNLIQGNRGENFFGESFAEDLINTFESEGNSGNPILVTQNLFRGGGPSASSGGYLAGDGGSDYISVIDNKVFNPGQYGVSIAGGHNSVVTGNWIWADQLMWNNIGAYIATYPPCAPGCCGGHTFSSTNKIRYLDPDGASNTFWSDGNCSCTCSSPSSLTLAEISPFFPQNIFTFLTWDQVWQVREAGDEFRDEIISYGQGDSPADPPSDIDLSRPTAAAGSDQSISISTASLSASGSSASSGNSIIGFDWVQVSGPNTAIMSAATSSTNNLSGLITGTYVFRLETEQENSDFGYSTFDSDRMTITVSVPVGDIFYVSNTGSDAADGLTTGTAWQTISKVNGSTFSAGESILFNRDDIWREQLTVPSSGGSGNPITIGAYGTGAKPIINGANIYTGWTNFSTNVWSRDSPAGNGVTVTMVIDGVILSRVTSTGALIANTFYIDKTPNPDKIYIFSTTDPAGKTVEISIRQFGVFVGSKSNITLENLETKNCLYSGVRFDGNGIYSGNPGVFFSGNSIVDSVVASNSVMFGIVTGNGYKNMIIRDSETFSCGNGFYADGEADSTLFQRCTAHDIYRQFADPTTDGDGIGVYKSSFNTIEYCHTYDNKTGFGIEIDLDDTDSAIVIRYNTTHGNGTEFEGYGIATGNLIGLATTNLVYYNLSYLNGNDPTDKMGREIQHHDGNISYYNNTIYTTGTDLAYGFTLFDAGAVTLRNNIVYSFGGNLRRGVRRLNTIVLTSDNNLYFSTDANPFIDGVTNYSFAGWQGLGYDAAGIASDPLFTTNGSDFSLQATSPGINAGVDVGLTQDILGNPIVGLPDMGAYEVQGVPSNPPPTKGPFKNF